MSSSFETQWTVTHQAPLSMGFPRQEYWSGLPFPSSGDLPVPGTEPMSPALAGGFITAEPPGKPDSIVNSVNWQYYEPTSVSSQMFSFSSLFNSLTFNITWAQSKFSRKPTCSESKFCFHRFLNLFSIHYTWLLWIFNGVTHINSFFSVKHLVLAKMYTQLTIS